LGNRVRKKAALFLDYPPGDGEVFGQGRRERIAALTDLYPHVINQDNFDQHGADLADTQVIFATWGMPQFTETHFARLPKLEAVFYAAGNVRAFAEPLVEHGIVLVSAWAINAIPVAEMCLAQIVLSLRGYFRSVRGYRELKSSEAKAFWRPGVAGETIGLIGMGKIGTRLRELLQGYPLQVIAHDPFLTGARAAELDVERSRCPRFSGAPAWSATTSPICRRPAARWIALCSRPCARALPSSTPGAAPRWSRRIWRRCCGSASTSPRCSTSPGRSRPFPDRRSGACRTW
jgi:hypothetical protein